MRVSLISLLIGVLLFSGSLPAQELKQRDEITEISFERKSCHGFCPVDKVTFNSNGSHSYNGIRYVERIGNFQADPQEYKFEVLVKVLERVNYANLDADYGRGTSDDDPVVILTVTRGGKTKTITSYNPERTPIELVIIQSFIENVAPKIRWKKVE